MKKVLFASTALVAVAFASTSFAADPVTGSVGGYMQFGLIYGSDRGDEIGILRDGEIHLKAKGTSDNGLTFQVRVELEAFTTGDQIDENWASVSGSFGEVKVGSDDSASAHHEKGVFYGAVNTGYFDSEYSIIGVQTGRGDILKIEYTTPSFSGFSASVDWAPNSFSDGGGDDLYKFGSTMRFSAGASYEGEFNGVGIALGAGYVTSSSNDNQPLLLDLEDDWHVGGEVSFSGFGVGVHYESANNSAAESLIAVGATYSTGPWGFGVGYSTALSGADANNWGVWANYALAPGVVAEVGYEGNDGDTQETVVAASVRIGF